MKLWKTENVRGADLEHILNKLQIEDWEIFTVLREAEGFVVVAHREASRWEVEELANTPGWVEEARDMMSRGLKIQAIKHVREATGWGLKEAKEYVEREL